MNRNVTIFSNGGKASYTAPEGTVLKDFLEEKGYIIDAPCGGKGTCGKCRVKTGGYTDKPAENEIKLLGSELLEKGYVLSCTRKINSDIEIFLNDRDDSAVILTEGKSRNISFEPVIKKTYIELPEPVLEDQTSDLGRVLKALNFIGQFNDLDLMDRLPFILRDSDFKVTAVSSQDTLIALEPGNTSGRNYGIAVDIGTTTVAAYLIDLNTGKRLDVYSELNPQKKYGADVLSRIEFTLQEPENLKEMQRVIINCINNMAGYLAGKNGITVQDIYEILFVGNTTMMHFLMGLFAGNIARSPFITVTAASHYFKASDLGLVLNNNARAAIFPAVSGYIGADTVAAVLSSGMYEKKEISLLIDIGTNGEVVLGCADWLYSCSTAAGPAFEGANIRNGMGGVKGAIDKVRLLPEISYSVIGGTKPAGICGSGILDIVAQMLAASVIDETGRLADEDEEQNLGSELRSRLIDINGQRALLLVEAENSSVDADIAITQKDIRELQNAKAAIAAGIKTLAKHAGIKLEDITNVYIAGGFGNYIDKESALAIGLIPKELAGRIESIGNAAGEGAVEGLLSGSMRRTAEEIANHIKYIELSASADFVDEYIESMMF